MKPRDFLREPVPGTAILLTWSLDPVFFERLPLRNLRAGGASRVLVVADRSRLHEMAGELASSVADGRIRDLGRQWALDGVQGGGAFHPKLWLRVGPDSGRVWLGSGNLTAFGFGGQWEAGSQWTVGRGAADDGSWLRPILEDVRSGCGSESARAVIDDVLAVGWLNEGVNTTPTALWSGRATLASQLERRWGGRRFTTLTMLTGSTDVDGSLLRWAAKTFGVEQATVILTPARASFDPAALSRLPLRVRIAPFDGGNMPLHAKVLWLDGPDGSAAIMGSANCSASAWLRPIADGGNHELVAVYDSPEIEAFAELLADARDAAEPSSVLPAKRRATEEEERPRAPAFDLVQLDWDASSGEVVARLVPNPPRGAAVELRDHDGTVTELQASGETWRARMGAYARSAGWCVVRTDHQEFTTPFCCLADVRQLLDTTDQRRWHDAIDGLRELGAGDDQRRIVDDLVRLSSTFFQTAGVGTATAGGLRDSAERGAQNSTPLDPALLASARAHAGLSAIPLVLDRSAASLSGLLRAVFRFDDDPLQGEDDDGGDGSEGGGAELGNGGDPPQPGSERTREDVSRGHLSQASAERLAKHVERWNSELSGSGFIGKCSAEELLQAYAFPIALALVGMSSGWLTPVGARRWVEPCVAKLLAPAAFAAGYDRLLAAGRDAEVHHRFGDGHLLAAAAVAVAIVSWEHPTSRAVWMRRVLSMFRLQPVGGAQQVGTLLGAVRVTEEHAAARASAIEDVAALADVESDVRARWQEFAALQASAGGTWMRVGDIVFSSQGRWGDVQDECRLGTDRNVDVDWFGEVGGRGKMLIEHKGKPFLINLSLLFRRGVPAVLGYDSLCLSKGQLGPREGQSISLGTTRR